MILSHAWRSWQGAKGVALLAATALALGIGSTTAIYSVVNGVMLKPLPYRDGERFVAVFGAAFNDPERIASLSFKDARTYQERTRVFDAFGWFRGAGKNLVFAGAPYHINGVAVTPSLVHHLGVDPILGQWFQDQDGAVISRALWRRLGADPAIIGKPLTLDGRIYTVTGVMPETFRLPVADVTSAGYRADVWMPLDPQEEGNTGNAYFAYGRVKPDVPLAAAAADVTRVAAEIAAEDPANHPSYTARVLSLRETVVKSIRPTLLLLFAGAALLFLITCANAAGLLLARAVARARETATRVALGAGRGQLAVQYLAEGLLVAFAGAAGGVVLSVVLTPAIVSLAADYLPRADEIRVEWTVLVFALGAAIVASVLSSLAPLWQALRTAPADALGEGVRASAGARSRRVSRWLVAAEIALAFALLTASAMLTIHLRNLNRMATGFDPDRLLTFVLSLPGTMAAERGTRVPLQQRYVEALAAIPGVEKVAFASQLPLDGCCMTAAIYAEGRIDDPAASQRTSLMAVSPTYFETMGIPLRRGRYLTGRDLAKDRIFAMLNEAAARRYWGADEAVGAYGRFNNPSGERFQVIGIVGDVKNETLDAPVVPEVYILSSIPRVETMNFIVRSSRASASLLTDIRRVVQSIDPEQPIHNVATMSEIVQRSMTLERVASVMTGFFAASALLLAMLGVYGVVSYSVRQRTVEIGTRMALGASRQGVLALIVQDGLKMTAYGAVAGAVGALVAAFYLGQVLERIALGPAPFAYSTVAVGTMACTASILPGWRATLLSPMVAMRNQPESMWQAAHSKLRAAVYELSSAGSAHVAVPLGALITDFADSARQSASFPEAVRVALTRLRERVGAEWITLLERSGDEYRADDCSIAAGGFLLNRLRHYPHALALTAGDFHAWTQWAAEFRPEHVEEIQTLATTGARVVVPLRNKNEIVGVLMLGSPRDRPAYTGADKELLSSSAEVFALMIANARLNERALEQEKVRRDLALAAEVQRRLLPRQPPRHEAATLAAFTLPARSVGGDYYDFLEHPGGRLGVAVADVAGKGIAAALLMSVVQASLRVIAAEGKIPLSQLATRMNELLYRSTGSNKYATFFYAQLDGDARRLRYVNAGHNAPYLLRRTASEVEAVELSAGGTVLGLFLDAGYDDAEIDVRPGDLFVAFTDGVPEALNAAGEEFGEDRLKALLRDAVGCNAEVVSSRLADTMREWISGAEQHDDLTFVVVAVNGSAADGV
jgi:predicted permease